LYQNLGQHHKRVWHKVLVQSYDPWVDDPKSEAVAIRHHVATEIRAELGRQRISVRELGRRLGLPSNSMHQRLANGAHIDVGELHQIARLLSVPITRFFPAHEHDQGSPMGKPTVPSSSVAVLQLVA
jgi:hypothetical protein